MKFRGKLLALAVALYMPSGFASPAHCEVPQFICQPIGNLGISSGGMGYSTTKAVNNSGQVIGTSSIYTSGQYAGTAAIFWDHGQLVMLAPWVSSVIGLNNAGQVIGSVPYGSDNYGYVWSNGTFNRIETIGSGTLPNNLTNLISLATEINDQGQVAGATLKFTGNSMATVPIIWQGGQITEIVPTDDVGPAYQYYSNFPADMNSSGSVVGWYNGTLRSTGYVWTNGTFTPLDKSAGLINDRGDMAGYWSDSPTNTRSWYYRNGTLQILPPISVDSLGQSRSFTTAMNTNGWIIGDGWTFDGSGAYVGAQAILWHDGMVFGFGPDPDGYLVNHVSAINNRGQVMGYTGKHAPDPNDNLGQYGFFYEDDVTTFLRSPSISDDGHEYVRTSILTEDGAIFGTYYVYSVNSIAEWQAFLWRSDLGMVPLDTLIFGGLDHAYWDHLASVTGISDNGQWITGTGITVAGNTEGFVLQLVPEPGPTFLLALVPIVLFRRQRT